MNTTAARRYVAVNNTVIDTATGQVVKTWGGKYASKKAISDASGRNLDERFGKI